MSFISEVEDLCNYELNKFLIEKDIKISKAIELLKFVLENKVDNSDLDGTMDMFNLFEQLLDPNRNRNDNFTNINRLITGYEGFVRKVFYMTQRKSYTEDKMKALTYHLKIVLKNANINMSKEQKNIFFGDNKDENVLNSLFRNEPVLQVLHFLKFNRNDTAHKNPEINIRTFSTYIHSIVCCYLLVIVIFSKELQGVIEVEQGDNDYENELEEFLSEFEFFDSKFNYILLYEDLALNENEKKQFAKINWNMVIDLEQTQLTDGLFGTIRVDLENRLNIETLILDENEFEYKTTRNTLYWIKATGTMSSKSSLLENNSLYGWKDKYYEPLGNLTKEFSENSDISKRNIVFICSRNFKLLEEIILILNRNFKKSVTFVLFEDISNKFTIDFKSMVHCVDSKFTFNKSIQLLEKWESPYLQKGMSLNQIHIPSKFTENKLIAITEVEHNKIKRYFTLVFPNMKNYYDENSNKSFFQGRTITWKEIFYTERLDIEREITNSLLREIELNLKLRNLELINFAHHPGAGGTTVAKRICSFICKDYPTLYLEKGDIDCIEDIIFLYEKTNSTIFVVIDNLQSNQFNAKELLNKLEEKSIKAVILNVERSFDFKNNKYCLPSELTNNELKKFIEKYSGYYTDFPQVVEKIKANNDRKMLTPFYLGLIIYEKNYVKLDEYVKLILRSIPQNQKDILTMIAYYTYFSNQQNGLPANYFRKLLKLNDEDNVILQQSCFKSPLNKIIIEQDALRWSMLHRLVAEEVLKSEIGLNNIDKLNIGNLAKYSIKFIETIRETSINLKEDSINVLASIFVLRKDEIQLTDIFSDAIDTEPIVRAFDKKFTMVINTLERKEFQFEVLEKLAEEFGREQRHFYGHLARIYYHYNEHAKAFAAIEKAISIASKDQGDSYYDSTLHHIKGMCYKTEAQHIIQQFHNNEEILKDFDTTFKAIKNKYNLAIGEFEKTRRVNTKSEHGYISQIQFASRIVDFCFNYYKEIHNITNYKEFFEYDDSIIKWIQKIIADSTNLLHSIKYLSQENISNYIKTEEVKLMKYFKESDILIKMWNKLLQDTSIDSTLIRRNIITTRLASVNYKIDKISEFHAREMKNILEEIFIHDPKDFDIKTYVELAQILKIPHEQIIKKLLACEAKRPTLQAKFYLYALAILQNVQNDIFSDSTEELIKDCRDFNIITKTFSNNTYCPEWIGIRNKKLSILKTHEVGEWNKKFFKNSSEVEKKLYRFKGLVKKSRDVKQGYIEILDSKNNGTNLTVLYVPGSANHDSSDENKRFVEFNIGLSFFGPRAFNVQNAKL